MRRRLLARWTVAAAACAAPVVAAAACTQPDYATAEADADAAQTSDGSQAPDTQPADDSGDAHAPTDGADAGPCLGFSIDPDGSGVNRCFFLSTAQVYGNQVSTTCSAAGGRAAVLASKPAQIVEALDPSGGSARWWIGVHHVTGAESDPATWIWNDDGGVVDASGWAPGYPAMNGGISVVVETSTVKWQNEPDSPQSSGAQHLVMCER